jgi:hypothetical protein
MGASRAASVVLLRCALGAPGSVARRKGRRKRRTPRPLVNSAPLLRAHRAQKRWAAGRRSRLVFGTARTWPAPRALVRRTRRATARRPRRARNRKRRAGRMRERGSGQRRLEGRPPTERLGAQTNAAPRPGSMSRCSVDGFCPSCRMAPSRCYIVARKAGVAKRLGLDLDDQRRISVERRPSL